MATTYTLNTTQLGQAQKGLEADYYQMEAWDTASDDVSASGNLNYQEVELKLDKDMLDFGNLLDSIDDSAPAQMRSKAAEEASFFTQGDNTAVGEMSNGGMAALASGGDFTNSVTNLVQNFAAPPLAEGGDTTSIIRNNSVDAPDTNVTNGGVNMVSSEEGSVTNIFNGCCPQPVCCGTGGDIIINVDTVVTNVINVAVDVITIGGDIINIDLGGGGGGGITINPDITINLGDVFNSTIGVIVDLGDTLNIGGDVNLELVGIDVDAVIDLGLGDGGLNLGVDVGLGDVPLLGDALDTLLDVDLGMGEGGLNLDAEVIGGDLLDVALDLGGDGLGADVGLGLPPLLGGDPLNLLDVDIDLGDGLGLGADILGEDVLDVGLLGEDGLALELLGEDLLGDDNPVGDILDGAGDVVGDVLGGLADGDPLGGLLDGELLDVELLNVDGALLDVDVLGEDLIGDDGLLGDVVGEDGILDDITDNLGGALDLIDLELGSEDGGLDVGLDVIGEDLLDVDLLGDGLLDIDLGGNDLIGGDNPLDDVADAVGDVGDAVGDLVAPVVDILPDIPILPPLFGGWH